MERCPEGAKSGALQPMTGRQALHPKQKLRIDLILKIKLIPQMRILIRRNMVQIKNPKKREDNHSHKNSIIHSFVFV